MYADHHESWAPLVDRLNPKRTVYDPQLKEEWLTMTKHERKRLLREDRKKIKEVKSRGSIPLPFETIDDDHCETSPIAYSHIVPILNLIAKKLKKDPEHLLIYDPYYCAGGVIQHMKKLGFPRVHNIPEDFYLTISNQKIPQHDVVLTNPPYSGDHFDRLLEFLKRNGKPFLMLLPVYFGKKSGYKNASWLQNDIFYLAPTKRYHYWTPEGRRPTEKGKHRNIHLGSRNSPFSSSWFISMNPLISRKKLLKLHKKTDVRLELSDDCILTTDISLITDTPQTFHKKEDPKERTGKRKRESSDGKFS